MDVQGLARACTGVSSHCFRSFIGLFCTSVYVSLSNVFNDVGARIRRLMLRALRIWVLLLQSIEAFEVVGEIHALCISGKVALNPCSTGGNNTHLRQINTSRTRSKPETKEPYRKL